MADLAKRLKKTFWFDHRTDLPQWLSIGIGQLMVEWSVLEKELEEIIRVLINGEIQQTRVMLFKVNGRTRLAIIKAQIEAHILHGRLKRSHKTRFIDLNKKIGKEQQNRNLLAHCLWTKRGKSWVALQTRDSRAIPELRPTLDTLSMAVLPKSVRITRASLRGYCKRTVRLARAAERLAGRLEHALGPLRDIPPPYTRRRPNYRPDPKKQAP